MSEFKEYVTSTAFNINLSKNMCELLLSICDDIYADNPYTNPSISCSTRLAIRDSYFMTSAALKRRGLAKHVDDVGTVPTEEGRQLAVLLRLAGFESYQDKLKRQNAA